MSYSNLTAEEYAELSPAQRKRVSKEKLVEMLGEDEGKTETPPTKAELDEARRQMKQD